MVPALPSATSLGVVVRQLIVEFPPRQSDLIPSLLKLDGIGKVVKEHPLLFLDPHGFQLPEGM